MVLGDVGPAFLAEPDDHAVDGPRFVHPDSMAVAADVPRQRLVSGSGKADRMPNG